MIFRFKWLSFVLAIQLAILGLVVSSILGYDLPVIRQIVGFLYLTFVPGFLLMKFFRMNRLGIAEKILYSVGLSLAFIMLVGFFINSVYPLFGINQPISLLPLIITLSVVVILSCAILSKTEIHELQPFEGHKISTQKSMLSSLTLLFILLPLVAAVGAFWAYLYQTNTILQIFIVCVALFACFAIVRNLVPSQLFPFAIVAMSLGLIWQYSLISFNLTGFDIQHHYYVQNLVIVNSIWDPSYPSTSNGMLSVVMLGPIYSIMLNLDTVWVYKIIYPILFSFVPLALYQAFSKQLNPRLSFFAAFFFISIPVYYGEVAGKATQPIAELFLALTLLLFVSKEIPMRTKSILLIIFGFAIIVSHYGLSYIYMLYLVLALLLRTGLRLIEQRRPLQFTKPSAININYVLLFVVFGLFWYIYISPISFLTITNIGEHLYSTIFSDFLSPSAREDPVLQAIGIGEFSGGIINYLSKAIYYIIHLFIVIGVISQILKLKKSKFSIEFNILASVSIIVLGMTIVVPYFASAINITRIYHISLFILSPYGILGGMIVARWLLGIIRIKLHYSKQTLVKLSLGIFLVFISHFLFQSGFIGSLTNTIHTMPLGLYEQDHNFFTKPEVNARAWIVENSDQSMVYGDAYSQWHLHQQIGGRANLLPFGEQKDHPDGLIFLRRWNILYDELLFFKTVGAQVTREYIELNSDDQVLDVFSNRNKLYDNGTANVYR